MSTRGSGSSALASLAALALAFLLGPPGSFARGYLAGVGSVLALACLVLAWRAWRE